jgi:purine-nucleoside phosphorylase
MSEEFEKIRTAANFIKSKTKYSPKIGLMLGSGLGKLAETIEKPDIINYKDIPGFPVSTVEGHKGCLVIGKLCGKEVICMQGRFHYYEGYSMRRIAFPIRAMKLLGIDTLIVTNAAGGINENFVPGDLMIINDHINLMGTNPLIGQNVDEMGPRFPDMSEAYSKNLIEKANKAAKVNSINVKNGVYLGLTGPSYETPAEIRMFKTIGADAVGMSTVPEVIAANHANLKVLGVSCITNMAAGITNKKLSHDEVIRTTDQAQKRFENLIMCILKTI